MSAKGTLLCDPTLRVRKTLVIGLMVYITLSRARVSVI